MKQFLKLLHIVLLLGPVFFPALIRAQTSPLLQVHTIEILPGGPLQFTFRDDGTGATAYRAEFSPLIGAGATWTEDQTAVITSKGAGEFDVMISEPAGPVGFYRVLGLGGAGGDIIVSFVSNAFQVSEGDTISPTVTFSAPFTGTIRYTLSGTAAEGDFHPLSGELHVVNSLTATFPVTFLDNESIGELRSLILTLESAPGTQLGVNSQTTIMIDENDAVWEGSFISGAALLPFTLEIVRIQDAVQGTLTGNDSSFFPPAPVPAAVTFTSSAFVVTTDEIALLPNATLLDLPSVVELHLSATNGIEEEEVSDGFIQGKATLLTLYPGHAHLDTTTTGTFLLQRRSTSPSTQEVELNAAP